VSEALATAPGAEYERRLKARREAYGALSRQDRRLSHARLAIVAATIAVGVVAWRDLISPLWLLAPGLAFLALVVRHDRVIRGMRTAERAIALYERGIARLEDRWAGDDTTGERFADDAHLYARDLDLFGKGSLFQLLSIARTRAGEQTLAEWLKAPAAREEILARQQAVAELAPRLDLREEIAIAGTDVRGRIDPDALVAWAEAPVELSPPLLRYIAMATTLAAVVTAILVFRGDVHGFVLLLALAAQGAVAAPRRHIVDRLLHGADAPARELIVLREVLLRLERQTFAAPRLQTIRGLLVTDRDAASRVITSLKSLIELHDWQHNIIFAPIAAMLLWEVHLAWMVQRWRLTHGPEVRRWLDAAGQFEAFSSLAGYHYERPADPFPDIVAPAPGGPRPIIEGRGLGHPLIPSARMVRNNVSLTDETRLLVISGSNMSGKSTLLRTVGLNAVLALAGAPVRAAQLRLTPLSIGATLRIQDSLQEGRSRFYAEITRIREVSDIAQRGEPLLFLLDELLHGTNSHDRVVGASGILRGLVERGAIGLITTHDLALTAIVESLKPQAANVHFDDWFEGSEIRFDYTMKPGPVTRSNAVALMRAVGLDVPLQ
jgi:hypothetical protein